MSDITKPPISSISDHLGGSCEDGYLVQFILTDEAEYRAWMAWLRDQRIKGLEAASVFFVATTETAPITNTGRRPIKAGDKLLCDGWAFGFQTFDGHPCVATGEERMVCGQLHAPVKDDLGISHLYAVEKLHHVES